MEPSSFCRWSPLQTPQLLWSSWMSAYWKTLIFADAFMPKVRPSISKDHGTLTRKHLKVVPLPIGLTKNQNLLVLQVQINPMPLFRIMLLSLSSKRWLIERASRGRRLCWCLSLLVRWPSRAISLTSLSLGPRSSRFIRELSNKRPLMKKLKKERRKQTMAFRMKEKKMMSKVEIPLHF